MGVIEAERAAVEKTYYDASGLLDRRSAELLQLTREHRNLNGVSDRQRTAIAGLETQIASLDMKLEASESDVSKTKKTLSEKISLAQFMERERDQFRADAVAARERREALLDNINAQQQLVDKLDAELRSGRRERAKLTETLNQLNDQLAAARSTEDRLRTDIRSQARGLEQAKHSLAEREEAQKAAQTVTQGALDAARRDNQNLRSEVNSLRRSNTPASLARLTTAAASTVRTANVEAERGRSGPVADGDVAGIRGMVADFGSDIIRAAAALDKAAGQNVGDDHLSGPKAGELEASVRELERKLSGLPGV